MAGLCVSFSSVVIDALGASCSVGRFSGRFAPAGCRTPGRRLSVCASVFLLVGEVDVKITQAE